MRLTKREREVATLAATKVDGKWLTVAEIAAELAIPSPRTVNAHIRSIADKVRDDSDLELPALRLVRRWALKHAA